MFERFNFIRVKYPGVMLLGLVSFFADIASEMLYPITPVFLSTVLGASMTSVGLIEGIAEGVASLLKTFSGFWSDQIVKRKPFIVWGYAFSALSRPLIGLSTIWPHVLGARCLDRTGKGLRSAPRDALIADYVDSENRSEAFGWHRSIDTFGAVLGPILALGLLYVLKDDLRSVFIWAAIPGFISVLIALKIKETKQLHPQNKKKFSLSDFTSMSTEFKKFLYTWTVFAFTNSSDAFLILRAKSSGLSMTEVILLYALYNLVYALLSPYFGRLSDLLGPKKILSFGLAIFAVVYWGFSVADNLWHFVILFSVYGSYMAMTEGVSKSFALDLVDPKFKASALGLLGTFTGIATIAASIVAGYLWEHHGAEFTFYYGVLGALVSLTMIQFLKPLRS